MRKLRGTPRTWNLGLSICRLHKDEQPKTGSVRGSQSSLGLSGSPGRGPAAQMPGGGTPPGSTHSSSAHFVEERGHWSLRPICAGTARPPEGLHKPGPPCMLFFGGTFFCCQMGTQTPWDGCLSLARLQGSPEWELQLGPQLSKGKTGDVLCPEGENTPALVLWVLGATPATPHLLTAPSRDH